MSKRIIIICCAIIIIFSLTGCQLAREDGLVAQTDSLAGVFITTEYLDLFDFQRYMQEQKPSFIEGDVFIDNNDYNGRIYAELKSKTYTDEETGQESEYREYEFKNLEGVPFFLFEVTEPNGTTYSSMSSGDSVCDAHVTIGDSSMIEGIIYLNPDKLRSIYINPVYRTADNRIYVKSGQGMFFGEWTEGSTYTQSIEEKHTITENGQEIEKSFKATITVAVKNMPTDISIIQMGPEHKLVKETSHDVATLPESIKINPDVEYVILETCSVTDQGEIVQREILDSDNEYYSAYRDRGDGIYKVVSVKLIWE